MFLAFTLGSYYKSLVIMSLIYLFGSTLMFFAAKQQ